jgi:hypothetical protein
MKRQIPPVDDLAFSLTSLVLCTDELRHSWLIIQTEIPHAGG